MAKRNRTQQALSILLPIGVLGASGVLATAQAAAPASTSSADPSADASAPDVAARLQAIRESAGADATAAIIVDQDEKILLAQWVNVGGGVGWRNGAWRNAGWNNGGWRNAGWGNGPWRNGGWRNGPWRNGGWNNWGNGGWHNFWNNW